MSLTESLLTKLTEPLVDSLLAPPSTDNNFLFQDETQFQFEDGTNFEFE